MPEKIESFQGEYRWLSNFWPAQIEMDGAVYATTEHAYQAAKTLAAEEREWVRFQATPGQAKRAGKHLTMRPDWDDVKLQVMAYLTYQKYRLPDLREKLLATDDALIEEGNTWGDTFWGVCRGKGQNHLGKLLMAEREAIRNGER